MQDEYGRPLSDDGAWVWDGSGWRPTGGGAPGGFGQDPETAELEPTRVAPRDDDLTGGQGEQPYQQTGHPYPPQRPTPFYKKPGVVAAVIGLLLVLSAVLVTVILLTGGGGNDTVSPPPTVAPPAAPYTAPPSTAPPSTAPTAAPTTEVPTQEPTSAPTDLPPAPSSGALPSMITPGLYECTSGGSRIGTATFAGTSYTTDAGGSGTYQYDESSQDISFTGGDLGDYTGTYDPGGPSMELTSSSGGELHCAQ